MLTLRTELPMPEYAPVATREAFYARVLQEVRRHARRDVGRLRQLPADVVVPRRHLAGVGRRATPRPTSDVRGGNNVASLRYVTPGYFAAMGTPIKRGRDIAETDSRDRPFVAVVSESFVQALLARTRIPIGRHFTFAFADREVVGVVGDVRFRGLERESEPQVYLSSQQVADGAHHLLRAEGRWPCARRGEPAALAPSRPRASSGAPTRSCRSPRCETLARVVDLETASRSVQVRVLAAFAVIAFVLAAVGIHGLLSFTVSQRTQEIGVRIALGAQSADILVDGAAALPCCWPWPGSSPAIALAYAAGRSMEALLAGVKPGDLARRSRAPSGSAVADDGCSAASRPRSARSASIRITALRAD